MKIDKGVKKMSCEKPIFIMGAGSSGTTLLGVILDRHSEVACGPEIYFFDKAELYGNFDDVKVKLESWIDAGVLGDGQIDTPGFFFNREAYGFDREGLLDVVKQSDSLREISDLFFDHFLDKQGKKRWTEKTGSNAYCMDEILKIYPEARLVHLVRDGRDVACSMSKRCGSMYHSASHWLYNVSASVKYRGDERYLEVKYEDLVSDPEAVLEVICHHVGIEFEVGMLETGCEGSWAGSQDGNIHASWKQSPFSGGISSQSVGRYIKDMTEDDAALFWRVRLTENGAGRLGAEHRSIIELMSMFGYDCHGARDVGALGLGAYREAFDLYRKRVRLERDAGHGFWRPLTRLQLTGMLKLTRSRSCAA